MHRIVNDEALDALFRAARSPETWLDRPVGDTLLRAVWELVSLGPTGGVGRRARVVFVKSAAAKARLAAAVAPAGEGAILRAPVTAIIAHPPCRDGGPSAAGEGRLAAAYLILAARALGLDCRPIWVFDAGAIDAGFLPDGAAADFMCALGYGDDAEQSPAKAAAASREACEIL